MDLVDNGLAVLVHDNGLMESVVVHTDTDTLDIDDTAVMDDCIVVHSMVSVVSTADTVNNRDLVAVVANWDAIMVAVRLVDAAYVLDAAYVVREMK